MYADALMEIIICYQVKNKPFLNQRQYKKDNLSARNIL